MSDITHQEIFVHKSGKQYRVRWIQDDYAQSPLEWSDCHGVVVDMPFNPLNAEQLEQHIIDEEPDLEEETRLRMLRPLFRYSHRDVNRLYYDVMASLEVARKEWGHNDPVEAMAAVDADYKYLKGWYEDDWHWVFLEVTAIEDGQVNLDVQYHVGGYESTLALDPDLVEDKNAVLNQIVKELEWNRRRSLHPGQLELPLHVPLT